MVMDNLIGRSIAYKKNIAPELKEEKINDYAYVLKTYELDGEYGGLFELDGKKEWDTTDEAQEAFDVAISTEEFSMVEFIRIDPNSNEHRETIIDIWEKDYKSEFTYVVKLYIGDDYQHNYIYNEKGSWSDQEEAKIAFNKAIECQEYSSIELVCKDDDDDYNEQLMDEWETDSQETGEKSCTENSCQKNCRKIKGSACSQAGSEAEGVQRKGSEFFQGHHCRETERDS